MARVGGSGRFTGLAIALLLAGMVCAPARAAAGDDGFHNQFEIGPLTVGYGSESARLALPADSALIGYDPARERRADEHYVDGRVALPGALDLELGVFSEAWREGDFALRRTEPRIALAFRPLPGQLLRIVSRTDMQLPLTGDSLPADALGVLPERVPLLDGGVSHTMQARWDAQWSAPFSTAVTLQQSRFDHYAVALPDGRRLPAADAGSATRLTLEGALDLGAGAELIAKLSRERGVDRSPGADGRPLLLRPSREYALDLRWRGDRLGTTLGADWVGPRYTGDAGSLPAYLTTHFTLRWEESKHRAFEISARNLLGERFEAAPGFAGPGREVVLGAELHF